MPDPDSFSNARPYFSVTFPSSGDAYSIAGYRNAFAGLGFLDMIPLQPRAHNPPDMRILVRGQDVSSFYNPVYAGDANSRIPFASGDISAISAPASLPRIDIVYMTPSGDYRVVTGTPAASPTLPTLAPSGDTRFPICAIWCKPSMTKIVNFEDKDSNTGDGYIYKDLRPWIRGPGAGAAVLTTVTPLSVTGDNAVGTAGTAARADHTHAGVHGIRKPGSSLMFGDVEIAGTDISQSGNRLTLSGETIKAYVHFDSTTTPITINRSFNISSITDDGAGLFTLNFVSNLPASFSASGTANHASVGGVYLVSTQDTTEAFAAGSLKVRVVDDTFAAKDATSISIMAV